MSEKYRLMIYFAHSTMVMYEASIQLTRGITVEEFYMLNRDVMKRVSEEAKNIFNYELSYNQVAKACYVYLQSKFHPQIVENTEAYKPPKQTAI